ncbi:MAG TPA: MATE family efflux transporter [Xanthobacteraceae bacterium]|jgi:putative MATE family efflux protein|nr:MATE family efflux transporter [Xanthobacteraceae bacterium]
MLDTLSKPTRAASPTPAPITGAAAMSSRTRALLEAPVAPLLARLAWPNILVMLAQSSTGLIEMAFIARLGIDALTGMALVLPVLILMQNMSQGAMGGGISSAIARALGGQRRAEADSLVLHALVINIGFGLTFSALVLLFGRHLFALLGGSGASLAAAITYSRILFAGMVLLWVFNALASIIRGTGNMLVPGIVICAGAVLLAPLSCALILGFGPIPSYGIAGGAIAMLLYYAVGTAILAWYVASGRNVARFAWTRLHLPYAWNILKVGAVAAVNTIQINVTIAATMGLVAAHAGPGAVAGFGTGTRLEYLLPPLAFGLGAPLVALVGTNIGAGQNRRALRIALIGGAFAFALTETVGIAAAIWPAAWLGLFDATPEMLEVGTLYLRTVGPFFGFFGLGMTLYFASQGAGRLGWPLIAGLLRMAIAVGGGALALSATGSLHWLFAVYACGLLSYGAVVGVSVASGSWFR